MIPPEYCAVHRLPTLSAVEVADVRRSALLAAAAVAEQRAHLMMARMTDAERHLSIDEMSRIRYAASELYGFARELKDIAGMVQPVAEDGGVTL